MSDGASFQIDLGVQGASGVESSAVALERLTQQLMFSGEASKSAAEAVSAGEASYRQAEASADRASKALERIGVAVDAQKGKLAAALEAGDTSGIEKAEARLAALAARQNDAATKAAQARGALDAEAAALDRLKSAASDAVASEEQLSKAQEAAEQSAKDLADAQEASAGNGSAEEAARGFGKLGGPLGDLGRKAFEVKGAMSKLTESLAAR